METHEILKTIIDEHGGHELLAKVNKKRLSALIKDYFPHDPMMCKALRLAVDENVACRLLKNTGDAPLEIKKLKFYLYDECGFDKRIASQLVDCFAFALGLGIMDSEPQTKKSDRTIRKDATSEQRYDSDINENSANTVSITNETKTTLHPAEPEMVFVQGGTFMMGATPEQGDDCYGSEKPAHKVTVSDFYIGKYEVTQAQWKALMGTNPSHFKGEKLPVEQVSWYDVQAFTRKLNALTGKEYRLPMEAEWEFAARGGNKSKGYKYSGGNNVSDVAWYSANSSEQTHPVGTKSPNELDIYDMSGNVYEWCSDWKGKYSSNAQIDPQGPKSGSDRVLRGGSWYSDARNMRVSFRNFVAPDYRGNILGLRLSYSSKQVC